MLCHAHFFSTAQDSLIRNYKEFTRFIHPSIMRVAFKMKRKPGMRAEYQKRHEAIWPELTKLIHDAEISNYSIFLDAETNILFAVQEVGPVKTSSTGKDPVVQQWWILADLMKTNPDNSPVSKPLVKSFFHLE